jgi:hypothetical protein
MDDHLGVGLRLESVPARQKLCPQVLVIVYFPVENNPDRAIFIGERLLPSAQVYDREPTVPESDWARKVCSLPVGAAVADGTEHIPQDFRIYHGLAIEIQFSTNATHAVLDSG